MSWLPLSPFVSKFYPYFFNVVCNSGFVFQRIVQKEIVTDGIDIVDVCSDPVFIGYNLVELSPASIDSQAYRAISAIGMETSGLI